MKMPDWERELFGIDDPPAISVADTEPYLLNGHPNATAYAQAALQRECAHIAGLAPDTSRNVDLNTAALRLGRHIGAGSIDEDTVREALVAAARTAGLPESEIATVLRDSPDGGIETGKRNPRYPAPRAASNGSASHAAGYVLQPATPFWIARPELLHVHDFARARLVSPWATLGVVLARVVTATRPSVVLPPFTGDVASLNTFVALVGPSGSGKGAAEAAATVAVDVGPITTLTPGSGEGIAHTYMRRLKDQSIEQHTIECCFSVAEIDTFAALTERRGATLLPELRRAWMGESLGFAYADQTKRLPVPRHAYRMTLIAGVQPGRAHTLLNDSDGGTPQRFLWLPATDPHAPDTAPQEPPTLKWESPRLRADFLGRVVVDVCDAARTVIDTNRIIRLRGLGEEALDGHALLCRLKVAAALSLFHQGVNHERRNDPIAVTDEDWELAGVIMDVSDATRAATVATLARRSRDANRARGEAEADRAITVEERKVEHDVQRVARLLLRKIPQAEGIARAELRRTLAGRDRHLFEDAVEALTAAGQITAETIMGQGDSGVEYRRPV